MPIVLINTTTNGFPSPEGPHLIHKYTLETFPPSNQYSAVMINVSDKPISVRIDGFGPINIGQGENYSWQGEMTDHFEYLIDGDAFFIMGYCYLHSSPSSVIKSFQFIG